MSCAWNGVKWKLKKASWQPDTPLDTNKTTNVFNPQNLYRVSELMVPWSHVSCISITVHFHSIVFRHTRPSRANPSQIHKFVSELKNTANYEQYSTQIPHTHTRLTALCPGLPRRAGTRTVKPIRILQKQETVSVSGIHWAICKSETRSRQITMPAPHHSVFTGQMPFLMPNQQSTEGHRYQCNI